MITETWLSDIVPDEVVNIPMPHKTDSKNTCQG
jgi:hypothetical protein